MTNTIPVLDHGYVTLLNVSGPTRRPDRPYDADDRDPANCARVSFDQMGTRTKEEDLKLNRYLWEHKHTTPFEMCLAGDTRIQTFPCSGAAVKHYTIRKVAEAFTTGGKENAWAKLLYIRCVDPATGVVLRTKITRAWSSGTKDTWTVRVGRLSREITATDNHPFLCPDGVYRTISELNVGDEVCMNGVPATPEDVVNQILTMRRMLKPVTEIADAVGVDPKTVSKYVRLAGMGRGFVPKGTNKSVLPSVSLVYPHARAQRLIKKGKCELCDAIGTDVHHIDQNPSNNNLGNLIRLCSKHHRHVHTHGLLQKTAIGVITSIEYAGPREVFDIEVASEHHNFIAEGFVVHNCETWWEMKLPIFVARQLVRHRTASINEVSRRYVDEPPEFYSPDTWRAKALDKKQGSSGVVADQQACHCWSEQVVQVCANAYALLLKEGVASEQARMVLPQSTYTKWVWQQDLHNLLHLIKLRTAPDVQWETRQYAEAMLQLLRGALPDLMETVNS